MTGASTSFIVDATMTDTGGGGGSGTVTNVSVVSANGLAGSVANATTTPAITLSTSITGVLKGNGTAISAAVAGTDYQAPITLTTTGSSGAATFTSNTLNIPNYAAAGVSSVSNSDGTLTISPTTGAVVASLAALTSANILVGNGSNVATGVAVSGDATLANTGALTVTKTSGVAFAPSATTDTTNASNISSGSLALSHIATIANNTVLGNVSGSTASPSAVTATQLTALINNFTSSLSGAVPSSGGGTSNFLRADGTWASPASSGTVTSVSVVSANGFAGSVATATSTPAITISTTITGVLKGNGTAISAATAGTDYQAPITLTTTGTSGAATFTSNTLNIPNYSGVLSFTGDGTLISNSASTGAVTATLANAAANTVWGNNTGSGAAPGYQTSISISGTIASAAHTITSASATALAVGANGTTNSVFSVDASTASVAAGITVIGAVTGGTTKIQSIDSGANSGLQILPKGSGNLTLLSSTNSGTCTIQSTNTTVLQIQATSTNIYQANKLGHVWTTTAINTASVPIYGYTAFASTGLTASTEAPYVYYNMGQTRQHATGALALQRDARFTGSTHSFVGASTATDVATLAVDGFGQAGTNATITNAHGIYIPIQAVAGTVNNAYGITVNAPTGAGTNNFALNVLGTIRTTGLIGIYNSVATAGWGVPAIYGSGRSTAQTAAVASVAAYTVGAADGTFIVSSNVNITASATHSFTVTVTYTDETNTSRTLTLNFSQITGTLLTAITNVQGTGAYEGVPLHIRCKASTSITIASTGTFTSVTYNIEGLITEMA